MRMTVELLDDERDALLELAAHEKRDPRQQAALAIRHDLQRRGLLQPDPTIVKAADCWHKWPEERPPVRGRYLILHWVDSDKVGEGAGQLDVHCYMGEQWQGHGWDQVITHWRPLPESPESLDVAHNT